MQLKNYLANKSATLLAVDYVGNIPIRATFEKQSKTTGMFVYDWQDRPYKTRDSTLVVKISL